MVYILYSANRNSTYICKYSYSQRRDEFNGLYRPVIGRDNQQLITGSA